MSGRLRFSIALTVMLVVCQCYASRQCDAQTSDGHTQTRDAGFALSTIDARTAWAMQTISPVVIDRPIIRLADIVRPLDPNMGGWQRLKDATIGLAPLEGTSVRIDRERLTRAILNAEATPKTIQWIGPEIIEVRYQKKRAPMVVASGAVSKAGYQSNQNISATPLHPASSAANAAPSHMTPGILQAGVSPRGDSVTGVSGIRSGDVRPDDRTNNGHHGYGSAYLTPQEINRVVHWIQLAVRQLMPEVAQAYAVEIDPNQHGLAPLKPISGVISIRPLESIGDGTRRFRIVGRSIDGPITTDVDLDLSAHPMVAVARKSLARGHVIKPGDLELQPLAKDQIEDGVVTHPDEVVGMEVRTTLRANRPVNFGDLGQPLVIHRGDLIEVRVVGGGVTIVTNGKALGNGAVSELIEVEIVRPKRRLIARVAGTGVAEIITRAPNVQP